MVKKVVKRRRAINKGRPVTIYVKNLKLWKEADDFAKGERRSRSQLIEYALNFYMKYGREFDPTQYGFFYTSQKGQRIRYIL